MHNPDEQFWPDTCFVCRQPFLSDGEPCCADIVCQAIMARQMEQYYAVQEAEAVVSEATERELVAAGL